MLARIFRQNQWDATQNRQKERQQAAQRNPSDHAQEAQTIRGNPFHAVPELPAAAEQLPKLRQ